MFFNPRFGLLGMISYPYWFFFEFLAPIVEFIGTVSFIIFTLLGLIDWAFFLALLGFIYSFGILYSIFAILMEVLTYNQYKKQKDILNIDLLRKKNSWGEMTRQGFSDEKKLLNWYKGAGI